MVYSFRQLIEHELCVARKGRITRSQTTRGEGEYADLDWERFNRLFDDTILEGSKGSGKASIKECAIGAERIFLKENFKAIKSAFELLIS